MLVVWAAVLLTYGVSAGDAMDPAGAGAGIGAGVGAGVGAGAGIVFAAVARSKHKAGLAAGVGAGVGAAVGAVVRAVAGTKLPLDMAPNSVDDMYSGAGAGAVAGPSSTLQLDMALNSVDDMYSDCKDKMYGVVSDYLQNERNKNSKFKTAWDSSPELQVKKLRPGKSYLGKERIAAIQVYTSGPGNIYQDFNDAVRTGRPEYKTSFGFHALHFYLTDAVQTLNSRRRSRLQDGEDECLTGYRRTDSYFDHVPNTPVRFGSFASSSLGWYSNNVEVFGNKTCFEVVTCMGVDVSMFSKFENEAEVLIPPYEVFKVVGIKKRSQHPDLPCEVEYQLKSTGTPVSELNCALFKK